MIIIEGLDGTGKTTVAARLEEYGMNVIHCINDESSNNMIQKYTRVCTHGSINDVLDRSFISEVVYGPILRGYSSISMEEYKYLLKYYASFNSKIVYLTADMQTLLHRRKNDINDMMTLNEHYWELCHAYDVAINIARGYMEVQQFDTKKYSVQNIINELIDK